MHDLYFRRVERSGFTKLVKFQFHDLGLDTKQKIFGKAHAEKKDNKKFTEVTGNVELDYSETFTDEDIEQEENPGNRKLMAKIVKLEAIIRELYEEDYKAVKVNFIFLLSLTSISDSYHFIERFLSLLKQNLDNALRLKAYSELMR